MPATCDQSWEANPEAEAPQARDLGQFIGLLLEGVDPWRAPSLRGDKARPLGEPSLRGGGHVSALREPQSEE